MGAVSQVQYISKRVGLSPMKEWFIPNSYFWASSLPFFIAGCVKSSISLRSTLYYLSLQKEFEGLWLRLGLWLFISTKQKLLWMSLKKVKILPSMYGYDMVLALLLHNKSIVLVIVNAAHLLFSADTEVLEWLSLLKILCLHVFHTTCGGQELCLWAFSIHMQGFWEFFGLATCWVSTATLGVQPIALWTLWRIHTVVDVCMCFLLIYLRQYLSFM